MDTLKPNTKRFRRAFIRGHCLACGKPVIRFTRTKVKWCSDACRKAANRACPGDLQAEVPAVRTTACNPLKSLNEKSRFSRSSTPISLVGGFDFGGRLDPALRLLILAVESRLDVTQVTEGVTSNWTPSGDGADCPDIPEFLRRESSR